MNEVIQRRLAQLYEKELAEVLGEIYNENKWEKGVPDLDKIKMLHEYADYLRERIARIGLFE